MKISSPLVAAAMVLLLTVATVQGIRLDAEIHAALSNQELNLQRSGDEGAVSSLDAVSEEKERARHREPENDIHVDYYGPRGHIPSHN
ncbi:hypothetical protein BRADI_4g16256v3 [Brachypodium distachyon]|uniref:Uncharacterized protein n=1 Tax=Brachypodium distachyon TaxID=15368 RepID=A0A2K2CN63_BRADI|nr:hypothetical protein BRADI_4g16256v3 [Brachypodium distachyon]